MHLDLLQPHPLTPEARPSYLAACRDSATVGAARNAHAAIKRWAASADVCYLLRRAAAMDDPAAWLAQFESDALAGAELLKADGEAAAHLLHTVAAANTKFLHQGLAMLGERRVQRDALAMQLHFLTRPKSPVHKDLTSVLLAAGLGLEEVDDIVANRPDNAPTRMAELRAELAEVDSALEALDRYLSDVTQPIEVLGDALACELHDRVETMSAIAAACTPAGRPAAAKRVVRAAAVAPA